jgi:hypothetical protein
MSALADTSPASCAVTAESNGIWAESLGWGCEENRRFLRIHSAVLIRKTAVCSAIVSSLHLDQPRRHPQWAPNERLWRLVTLPHQQHTETKAIVEERHCSHLRGALTTRTIRAEAKPIATLIQQKVEHGDPKLAVEP